MHSKSCEDEKKKANSKGKSNWVLEKQNSTEIVVKHCSRLSRDAVQSP